MTSDEIRASFLSFFESKGHKIIPSSSLIPAGDPTLLLTTAGMVQFKPYFLGQATPPAPRLASCQKCFRTTDIESVGDPTHLTFFEMLGNFSIGDYFKKEAIAWAWEFVTQHLKLPTDRLWITIFLDDDEAFRHWREIGVPEQRIVRLGEKDNFWGPAGDSGPCGPCSEINYDLGFDFGCGKPTCAPGCECKRFSEIWNLVFTQYNQDKNGNRTPLPKPNIDTGMGLERVAAIMQGKTSVYETDLFAPLLDSISKLSGKKYGAVVRPGSPQGEETNHAMRVVAEHSRGIAFLIGDGVLPSNEGRGYVLRRLLRRAALFGRRLGLDKPFLSEIALTTIKQMGHVYPELVQRRDTIVRVTEMEEARFRETLNTGLELLGQITDEAMAKGQNKVSGREAFKLYDTYGFPVELTAEIARGRGLSVDMEGFEREMKKQRERARASHKFEIGGKGPAGVARQLDIKSTAFVGYATTRHESTVVGILLDGSSVNELKQGQEAGVILEATPFYGEMGGQIGDTGEIMGSSGRFLVTDTVRLTPGIILHQGRVAEGILTIGDKVEAVVDEGRRHDIARNHTATHLLQMALRQVAGEHIQQRGSLVAPDRFTFDFSHLTALTPEEVLEAQRIVNEKVRQNLPVYDEELPYKQAIKEGVIALFDEKYGDVVRVLRIGRPAVSAELCGGTHVNTTGEIGFFHIIGEHSIGSGLRRIEALTGRQAEAHMEKYLLDLRAIARDVGATLENVREKLSGVITEHEAEHRRVETLERELARREAEALLSRAEAVNGIRMVSARVSSQRIDILREMGDVLRDKLGSGIIVLGTIFEDKPAFIAAVTPDLVGKGYDAVKIVKEVAKVTGGGGGGKPTMAQAGGRDRNKLDEALKLVEKIVARH
ncbi:MAG: alanine--tRNA ligase [Chloroflexi bacterium]|nr:alanine--tRNA ligase [Chloroflexota bacterium]